MNGAGQEVRSPYGRAVHFTVIGKGALPESGSVDLIGEKGMKTSVTLLRSEENGIEDSQAYTGELSRRSIRPKSACGSAMPGPNPSDSRSCRCR